MNISKKTTIIISILFILLTSSIAFAEEFTISGPTKLNTFQCATHNYDIYVQNLGRTKNQYFLDIDTNAPEWVSVNAEKFSLEPGQAIKLQETLKIPCKAYGEKYADLYITTLDGTEKALQQDITTYKPENIKVISGVLNQTIDSCKTAEYKIKLENEFDFTETYNFKLLNKKYNAEINPQTFELAKNQTKETKINITPKDCELSGDQTLTLNINTEKTKLSGEIDLLLKINKTKTATIQTITINYDKKTSKINLKNAFNRKVIYDLRLKELDWASTDAKTITLEAGQTTEINITTEPKPEMQPQIYEAKLQIFDDEGKEHTQIIKINLKKPVDYKKWAKRAGITIGGIALFIIILTTILKLTSRKARLRRKEKRQDKERLKNELKKELQKEYRLISRKELRKKRKTTKWFFTILLALIFLTTPIVLHYYSKKIPFLAKSWALFSIISAFLFLLTIIIGSLVLLIDWERIRKEREQRKKDYLKFKEEKSQTTNQKNQQNTAKENKQTPKTTKKDHSILKKTFLTLLTTAILGAIGISSYLFRSTLIQYKEWTITGFAILTLLIILISYLSTRTKKRRYLFLEKGKKQEIRTKWRKGLLSVFFTINKDVQNFKIKIKKKAGSIIIKPSANIYQYFRIQSNQEDFQQIEFITKVKKSWLNKRNLKESDIRIKTYNQTAWENVKTEKTGEDNKYLYYLSTTNKTGTFAIVCLGEHRTKKTWGIYLSLFLLLGASIALVTLLTSQDIGQKGIPEQKLYKNEAKKLELKQYFTDPDGDKLNFSHTETQNVKIEIIDGTAIITPSYDWTGQEFVKFTASDGKDITESNQVRLLVQEKTKLELFKKYSLPAGLGILIFLIIGFMFAYRTELLNFLEEE